MQEKTDLKKCINGMDPEASRLFKEFIESEDFFSYEDELPSFADLTDEDIIQIIKENGGHQQENDYDYINHYYYLNLPKTGTKIYRFEATGSEYIKDQCICDEEMDNDFTVININEEKNIKAKEKIDKLAENEKKWKDLMGGIFDDETETILLEMFKKYDFPKEIK